jgi:hypothetical protein
MYTQHPLFRDPEKPFEFLWRYMDWPKFYWLLKSRKLFCPSASYLHSLDSFEGSLPEPEIKLRNEPREQIRLEQELSRKGNYISCWHYNDTESVAMWKLYAPAGYGLAIQTTIPEFKESFQSLPYNVFAGMVIYIDYHTDPFFNGISNPRTRPNIFIPFIHKRSLFKHENEYRAIITADDVSDFFPNGIAVPVDVNRLIKRVIVAPETPDWMLNIAQMMLSEMLPGVRVDRSIGDVHSDI